MAYSVRFGPRESKKAITYSDVGRLNCNVSYTTFASPALGSQVPEFYTSVSVFLCFIKLVCFQGTDHKEYSSMLHKALEGVIMMETFPKTTVDVFALVLESGGSKSHLSVLSFSLNNTQNASIRILLREKKYQSMIDNLWKHRSMVPVEFDYGCNSYTCYYRIVVWNILMCRIVIVIVLQVTSLL